MRQLTLLSLVLTLAVLTACDQVSLNTDKAKAGYAIGQQIGSNIKAQGLELDLDAVAAGMKDAAAGKQPRVKQEDMQKAMTALQQENAKKQQEQAQKEKAAGDEWLAKNKTQAGWQTTASGIQYKVVKEGSGPKPKDTDVVKVHYVGTLINGQKFDSSIDRGQPAEFPLNQVIKGWTEALQLMTVGSRYQLAIPPELAYGIQGRPGIPPNSVLLFDVELLDVKHAPAASKKK